MLPKVIVGYIDFFKVKYDTTKAVSSTKDVYTEVKVQVQLYSQELEFSLPEALNITDVKQMGTSIAKKALELRR